MSRLTRADNGDGTITITDVETGKSWKPIAKIDIERRRAISEAKHAERNPPVIEGTALFARLEDVEWLAIQLAATGNAQISRWLTIATAKNRINLASDETLAVKAALITAKLLTSKRADIVFAPIGKETMKRK